MRLQSNTVANAAQRPAPKDAQRKKNCRVSASAGPVDDTMTATAVAALTAAAIVMTQGLIRISPIIHGIAPLGWPKTPVRGSSETCGAVDEIRTRDLFRDREAL